MGTENAANETGKAAGEELEKAARAEERKVEAQKGSDLKKGAARVDERSRSSDGKGPDEKQR
jgi:hypothetical protein